MCCNHAKLTRNMLSRTMLKLTLLLAAISASFALNRSVIATPNAPGAIGPYSQGILLTLASGERMIHAAGQIGECCVVFNPSHFTSSSVY